MGIFLIVSHGALGRVRPEEGFAVGCEEIVRSRWAAAEASAPPAQGAAQMRTQLMRNKSFHSNEESSARIRIVAAYGSLCDGRPRLACDTAQKRRMHSWMPKNLADVTPSGIPRDLADQHGSAVHVENFAGDKAGILECTETAPARQSPRACPAAQGMVRRIVFPLRGSSSAGLDMSVSTQPGATELT